MVMLGYKADKRRGYSPLIIGIMAMFAIIGGKFYLDMNLVTYGGIFALITVSAWNAWPINTSEVKNMMNREIEIFSAGCPLCKETVDLVNRLACSSCDVRIVDMHDIQGATRARELGVKSVPAVAINGKLADCCAGRGPDESTLLEAGLGQPIG